MTRIVALCGHIGSGKTTYIARTLVEDHGFVRVRFAHYLKETAKLWGFTDEEIDGALKEVPCARMLGVTPRHVMRILGTEVGRYIHLDWWVHLWDQRVESILATGGKVVVDDCRFENEEQRINQRAGRILRVERPGVVAASNHPSDTYHVREHDVLVNDRDYSHIQNEVAKLLLRWNRQAEI